MILLSWGRSRKFKTQKLFAKVHHCSLPKKQNFPCQDYTISSITVYFENNVPQMKSPKDLVWENIVKISQFVVLISNVMCNFFQNPHHIPTTSPEPFLFEISCQIYIVNYLLVIKQIQMKMDQHDAGWFCHFRLHVPNHGTISK